MQAFRFPWRRVVGAALLTLSLGAGAAGDDAQRWDLADLYPSPAAWGSAYADWKGRVEGLDRYRESIGGGAGPLRDALVAISDAQRAVTRIYAYASLKADEDLREPSAQERKQQAQNLYTRLGEKTAWVAPAVQALGADRVRSQIAADPVLAQRFDLFLDDTLRNLPHTLSPEGESLLAAAGMVLAQPRNVWDQLAESELPRPVVKLSDGREVKLSSAEFDAVRQSRVRADRQLASDAYFGATQAAEGTFGANLATQVLGEVFTARARRFDTALSAALFADNMPPAVYARLIEQAHAGLPTLHRYLRVRREMLGLGGPLAYHDLYPPLVDVPPQAHFDLARAKAIALAALAPMGPEYLALLRRGLDSSWSDTHPRPGKASGAYMSSYAYDVHPYLLQNYHGDFESLSTLTHEWGHAVHSMLTNAAQPFDKSNYSTFIAESASIANEMLLSDHMIANAQGRDEKLFYLSQALESIRATFFHQVMFAEFQLAIHDEAEQGRPLSGARLSELYCGVARRFYGEAEGLMKIEPQYCVGWANVPHFFNGYYVWQYATSMVGAAQFSAAIQRDGVPARDRFITLLKAGGSDYAYPLYLKAGIDLAQPAPYQALFARMNRLLDEIERLRKTP